MSEQHTLDHAVLRDPPAEVESSRKPGIEGVGDGDAHETFSICHPTILMHRVAPSAPGCLWGGGGGGK